MKKYLLALIVLAPLHAFAIPITSSVGNFNVTTVNVRGTNSVLTTTAWWGSESLAREFAALANNDLGMSGNWLSSSGPMFAYKNQGDNTSYAIYFDTLLFDYVKTDKVDKDDLGTYAVSARISGGSTAVPEPTSLALLGVGLLALGLRRRFTARN